MESFEPEKLLRGKTFERKVKQWGAIKGSSELQASETQHSGLNLKDFCSNLKDFCLNLNFCSNLNFCLNLKDFCSNLKDFCLNLNFCSNLNFCLNLKDFGLNLKDFGLNLKDFGLKPKKKVVYKNRKSCGFHNSQTSFASRNSSSHNETETSTQISLNLVNKNIIF